MDVRKIDTLTDIHRHIRADLRSYEDLLAKFRGGPKMLMRLNLGTIGNKDRYEFNIEYNDDARAFIEKQREIQVRSLADFERQIKELANE